MKAKILFQLFLLSGLGIIYITMKSDINGKYNGGTSCSPCHGNQNVATTVAITGLPSLFVTGQTYPLTFTVTNATNPKAGFNIAASAGSFIAGTGSKINGGGAQITHTSPMTAVSNVTTFTFSWKAPNTTAAVSFNAVGNAVNDDQNDSNADQWNSTTLTINGSFPAGVSEVEKNFLKCYPNPSTDKVCIEGVHTQNIQVYNLSGQKMNVASTQSNNNCTLDCSKLAAGTYFVIVHEEGKLLKATFVKQ